ncbi:hypothetical protein ACS75_29415, partial [Bacillus thuringiensis]
MTLLLTQDDFIPIIHRKRYSFCRNIEKGWRFCMNLSIQDEFHLFAEELQRYLSPHILQQLAQETGFSKYGARDLAALCIWI